MLTKPMDIGAGGGKKTVLRCILIRQGVLPGRISCVKDLRTVTDVRRQMDLFDVAPLPVRMCLYHNGTGGVYRIIYLFSGLGENVRVSKQPVLIDTVDQVFIAFKIILHAEENDERDAVRSRVDRFRSLSCVLIAAAVLLYAIGPGKIPGNPAVSVKEMIS